jgi:hypothetical protein
VLSVVKLLALVWFVSMSPAQRDRLIKILTWVSSVFSGPVREWPLDFGRPLSEAEDVIASNRSAAAWVGRLAEQLQVVRTRLPE